MNHRIFLFECNCENNKQYMVPMIKWSAQCSIHRQDNHTFWSGGAFIWKFKSWEDHPDCGVHITPSTVLPGVRCLTYPYRCLVCMSLQRKTESCLLQLFKLFQPHSPLFVPIIPNNSLRTWSENEIPMQGMEYAIKQAHHAGLIRSHEWDWISCFGPLPQRALDGLFGTFYFSD